MNQNWYLDIRVVEELHRELRRAAEQRRLMRVIQPSSSAARRPNLLTLALALLGMQ